MKNRDDTSFALARVYRSIGSVEKIKMIIMLTPLMEKLTIANGLVLDSAHVGSRQCHSLKAGAVSVPELLRNLRQARAIGSAFSRI
jgi:hypothetical protein